MHSIRDAVIAALPSTNVGTILEIEHHELVRTAKASLRTRESIIDILRREFPVEFDVIVDSDFLPAIRRLPPPVVKPPVPLPAPVSAMRFSTALLPHLPSAPSTSSDPLELIERLKTSIKQLSISSLEDLIKLLDKTEDARAIYRITRVLSAHKSAIFQEPEDSIPRKRQKLEPIPPPQLPRNFVKKPPPPLETLVDAGNRPKAALEELEALNPPQPKFSWGLLQTIQLARIAKVIPDQQAKTIFNAISSNLG